MKNHLNLGNLGEKYARKFLQEKGYKILELNCKNIIGEIDLIALDKDTLVYLK